MKWLCEEEEKHDYLNTSVIFPSCLSENTLLLFALSTHDSSLNVSVAAACNVWYLSSVEMESLTGTQAVQKATTMTLNLNPPPTSTVVHFKVSSQGITLTDNQRK